MRPATASFVIGGSAWWPSSSRLASRCASRSSPAYFRWSGMSSPRSSMARSTRAQAATAACAERRRLASSKFTRRFAVARTSRRWRSSSQLRTVSVGAHEREHRADRLAVADDDPVHAAHLAGLRGDAEAAGRADERHRRLVAGAGDLERGRAARIGEAAVREERAAPDRGDLVARAGGELVGQPAHGTTAGVEQAGLACEGLAAVEHPHEVLVRSADAGRRDHRDVGAHAVELAEVARHAARDRGRVELRLDGDAAGDDVQPAGEAQHRGELGGSHARLRHLDPRQFFFHVGGQCHVMSSHSSSSSAAGSFTAAIAVLHADGHAREAARAGRRARGRSRPSGACRRCIRPRSSRVACSRAGTRPAPARAPPRRPR